MRDEISQALQKDEFTFLGWKAEYIFKHNLKMFICYFDSF